MDYHDRRAKRNTFRTNRKRRQAIINEQGRCQYCGDKEDLTVDHIRPLIKGGTNARWNLQVLCDFCNNLKGERYPFSPPTPNEIWKLKRDV